jgi:HTH-type transcriptional regulator / antitoxin HipB
MPTRITTLRTLAVAVKGRRLELGLSQAQIADQARVSRQWINEFEAGKPTAELGLVLRLLDALGLDVMLATRDEHERSTPPSVDLDALLDQHRDR